tara:strand:+ start:220305 stop:220658 length:354 start_codon:yes stop_codon:yes gene_type:complete
MQALENLPGTEDITKIPLQDENLYSHFTNLTIDDCYEEIHYIDENEQILKGNQVPEALINKFPAVKKFSWLIESQMGQKAIDYFHHVAANYRKKLKKGCTGCNNKKHRHKRSPDIGA